MRLPTLALVLVLVAACHRTQSTPTPATDAAAPVASSTAMPDAASVAAPHDAGTSPVLGIEQRRTYAKALAEGRREQRAQHWDRAVTAFDRALAVAPEDARALSEGGYARYERAMKTHGSHARFGDDLSSAKSDLELAALALPPSDRKLAAQVEYNLGLVCDALAEDDVENDDLRGVAAGHFRRSNELVPSKAASARMTGCPLGIDVPAVKIYPSLAAVKDDAGTEVEEQTSASGAYYQRIASDADQTEVIVPIDGDRFASALVGPTTSWHCGVLGAITASRSDGVWHIVYQAHHAVMGPGVCWCADESSTCEPWSQADDAPCACKDPVCQMSCGAAMNDEGSHEEIVLDAATGQGLLDLTVDHAFLSAVHVNVDGKARRLEATELGCAIDVHLPPARPSARDGGTK